MSSSPDALTVQANAINGLNKGPDVVIRGINSVGDNDNGDNGALSSAPDSPAIASPSTNAASPLVKIDLDYVQRDSDASHGPINISLELDHASTRPQLGTPPDPASLPIEAPKGTPPPPVGRLLRDVQMSEQGSVTAQTKGTSPMSVVDDLPGRSNGIDEANGFGKIDGINGHVSSNDMMVDAPVASSSRLADVNGAVTRGLDHPPPTKRARKLSDAEQASLAHSPAPLPPPSSESDSSPRSATPLPPKDRRANLSTQQFRFCISTVRQLRKLKDAVPFLQPVDAVALNIPHYYSIIKHPMDFSTIDRKLASSNPLKPDPNPNNPRYLNADEFITDVRRIFMNAQTFNGPEHLVTQMGKRVEAVFDKQIKQLPPPAEEAKPIVKKQASPPAPPPSVQMKKAPVARRPSTSIPTIRRNESTETARPKREIHPPPPKDLPYSEPPKKIRATRKAKVNDGSEEQLKYCAKILQDLHKKSLTSIASPFYEPVDPVKLNIPDYPKIVKKPMDLSTMKRKLENKEYPSTDKFYSDFALMIKNCMAFNPPGSAVHNAGVELQRIFEEKWASLPPLKGQQSEDEEEEEEEDSEEERHRTITLMESQIETMKGNLAALKSQSKKVKKEKKEKKRSHIGSSAIVTSSTKSNGKMKPTPRKKSSKKVAIPDDDVLSFDQKKDLSETIQTLEGDRLQKVIDIIHEGVPEIRDSTEEIELDIDQLPAPVLLKLYNFVLRPIRSAPTKRSRTGTGTGTGGLKRKSMDEDLEAEKIRQLEERMKMFDTKNAVGMGAAKRNVDSDHSSDDSSSDSSGSDSE